MHIIPSKELRNNYAGVSSLAHSSGEPIYVTKNESRDLVIMSADDFEKRDELLRLRHKVHAAEASRLAGEPTYPAEEAFDELRKRYI